MLYDDNESTLANADIQVNEDILNLLVLEYNEKPEQTADSLRADLGASFRAAGHYNCDPGFTLPLHRVPYSCRGGDAETALEALRTLRSGTSVSLCFKKFVQSALDEACDTQHLAAVGELDDQLDATGFARDALVAQLFFAFGTVDQDLDAFREFQVTNFDDAVTAGTFVGSAEL